MIRIGTAGWSLPRAVRDRFPGEASILERYAAVFDAVEINSSFYRPHRPQTYARWAASTPPGFRFALKLPRAITHERRLVDVEAPLDRFLAESAMLGEKRGPILIQLPPSLEFNARIAGDFLDLLRQRYGGDTACEPRHSNWFTPEAQALLTAHRIARVAADPPSAAGADRPGGYDGFSYWRLHGSPRMYATPYGPERVETLAARLPVASWAFFDNTMLGAATEDALSLQALILSRDLHPSAPDAKLGR